MRNVLGYIALVGSASLSEAALLYRRIGGSYTYELKDVTAPWTGKLGENDKYNFLVDRIGDYDPESDMVKCHGSCGSIMVLNRDGEVCKDPDNQQLADLCFGPCPALNPAAIYKPAIGYGKQCGFIPKEWTKEEARDAYLKKKASAATPTEAASSATPTQAAPQETSATEVPKADQPQVEQLKADQSQTDQPKADQSQTPAETETVTSTQVVQPAQSTTAALKPTQSTIAAPKPTETTDSSARSERSADSAATPVEVTSSGAKWFVSSAAVTLAALAVFVVC